MWTSISSITTKTVFVIPAKAGIQLEAGPIRINGILSNGAILPAIAGKIGFDWVCFGFVFGSSLFIVFCC
jgi:hypothetical protein